MNSLKPPVEPSPPTYQVKMAGHHWLEHMDMDGHSFGVVVLQWNPGAKRWSHSGNVGTGIYVDTHHWRYVGPCSIPGGVHSLRANDPESKMQMAALIDSQLDVTGATLVEVVADHKTSVLHVNVNGVCLLRICRVKNMIVDDRRTK